MRGKQTKFIYNSAENWNWRQVMGGSGANGMQWIPGETLEKWCQQLCTHMGTNPHPWSTGEALWFERLWPELCFGKHMAAPLGRAAGGCGRQEANEGCSPHLSLPEGTGAAFLLFRMHFDCLKVTIFRCCRLLNIICHKRLGVGGQRLFLGMAFSMESASNNSKWPTKITVLCFPC